ncbi:hypothetical protein [Marinobacter salsuginis]|uniref:hypothetical protein n=1 Tax=Marinobacter salsuginis TaxID=418719 RepID=UPI00129919FE|nr:hypothetical protein [Marinobacter salsuginis]
MLASRVLTRQFVDLPLAMPARECTWFRIDMTAVGPMFAAANRDHFTFWKVVSALCARVFLVPGGCGH